MDESFDVLIREYNAALLRQKEALVAYRRAADSQAGESLAKCRADWLEACDKVNALGIKVTFFQRSHPGDDD